MVVSSNPTHIPIKAPLVRKAAGNHLMISTFLEKLIAPCLWFLLRSSRLCDAVDWMYPESATRRPITAFALLSQFCVAMVEDGLCSMHQTEDQMKLLANFIIEISCS